MTRTRNIPAIDAARERYRNNDTWSDYDSDIIHGDYRVDEVDGVMEVTELRAYQPGIATVDRLAGGSSAVTYYHTDMIGTTRFMTDGNGVIGEEATYTAFGEKVCSLPGGDCTNTTDHRYGYAGAYGYQSTINDTTGVADFPFLHVGVRYYDPASGRFLQRDPIGIPGGLNVYEYVGNSPADSVDPTGNYRHRSFRLSNTGRLRYGCSHIRGKPANVSSNAFRILNKPWHIRGVAGAGLIAASCLLAGAGGAAAGRAIDNAVGRANGGFSISDGLADILFRWWNNDPDYDPSGGGGSGG